MSERKKIWSRDIREIFPGLPAKRMLPSGELAVFCRQLSLMLDAGIPVGQALAVIAGSTLKKQTVTDIRDRVARGDGFSRALSRSGVYPPFMCGLCLIGESTARLPDVMGRLAEYYERRSRSRSELVSALAYPAAVSVMLIAVTVLTLIYVLPQQAQVIAAGGGEMPGLTRALMGFADGLAAHFHYAAAGLAALAVLITVGLRSDAGQKYWAGLALKIPLYRLSVNLHITQSLHMLLSAGQPLTEAMPVWLETAENPLVRKDLAHLARGLAEGRAFWGLLAEIRYADPLLIILARVGEETGRLAQSLGNGRYYLEHKLSHAIRRWNQLVEPVVITVLGLVIGLVMTAALLPNFELLDAM